jgi:hypothetical protein
MEPVIGTVTSPNKRRELVNEFKRTHFSLGGGKWNLKSISWRKPKKLVPKHVRGSLTSGKRVRYEGD